MGQDRKGGRLEYLYGQGEEGGEREAEEAEGDWEERDVAALEIIRQAFELQAEVGLLDTMVEYLDELAGCVTPC
jgi:hypothetical protein